MGSPLAYPPLAYPLEHLERLESLKKQRSRVWLFGGDSKFLYNLARERYAQFQALAKSDTPPTILLAEDDPIFFLAGFVAAVSARCPVFLGNPTWVEADWKQVLDLVEPDILLAGSELQDRLLSWKGKSGKNMGRCDRDRIFIPTGGSSGQIQFAIHCWQTLAASTWGFAAHFQTENPRSFCMLPLYHVSGLMQFVRTLVLEGSLILLPSYKELFLEEKVREFPIGKHADATFVSLVPTQLQRLLANEKTKQWLLQFSAVLLGGGPAWPELLERSRQYGIPLAPTYGMTETAAQIATLKPQEFLAGKKGVGQSLPHACIRIVNPNERGIGTIAVSADSLALGSLPERPTNPTFETDDLGWIDSEGYLYVIGRKSDVILTGGEKVFAAEVEAAVRATGWVRDACVLGVTDREWGQAVTAVCVPIEARVSVEMLKAAIAPKLTFFKQPKRWIFLDRLPRNAQGKLDRKKLLQAISAD